MDEAELGFNAWVLVGNVLHHRLRGEAAALSADAFERGRLAAVDATLATVPPERMVVALEALGEDDRALLFETVAVAVDAAGEDVGTLLGLDRDAALLTLEKLRGSRG